MRVARTVREHFDGILTYVRERRINAIPEGINDRIRTVALRAFGFHDHIAVSAIFFLCCPAIVLEPPPPVTHEGWSRAQSTARA